MACRNLKQSRHSLNTERQCSCFHRQKSWEPQILRSSALEKQGIDTIWEAVKNFRESLKELESGNSSENQSEKWMWTLVEEGLLKNFRKNKIIQKKFLNLKNLLRPEKFCLPMPLGNCLKYGRKAKIKAQPLL